jgi:hypothetical protein
VNLFPSHLQCEKAIICQGRLEANTDRKLKMSLFWGTVLGEGRERQRHVLRRAANRPWGATGQGMGPVLSLEPGPTAIPKLLCHQTSPLRYQFQWDCERKHVPDEVVGFTFQGECSP